MFPARERCSGNGGTINTRIAGRPRVMEIVFFFFMQHSADCGSNTIYRKVYLNKSAHRRKFVSQCSFSFNLVEYFSFI
jgi:hypothetical protein